MNLFIFHNFKLFCCNCWESFTAHWLDLVAGVQLAQAGTVSRPRMAPIEWNKMSSLRMNYSDVRYPHLSRCEETAELSGEIWCLGWAPHQPCGQLSGQLVSAKDKFCYSGIFPNIISWLCQKACLQSDLLPVQRHRQLHCRECQQATWRHSWLWLWLLQVKLESLITDKRNFKI